jgi:uncharacterized membrane protein (DUF4010 family)
VLLIVVIVAPALWSAAALVFGLALAGAAPAVLWHLRRAGTTSAGDGEQFSNPTQLSTALVFGVAYAGILLLAAWASERLGAAGLYAVAAISGLTDVDAITLSSLQLHANEAIGVREAMSAIVFAVSSNLVLKAAMVAVAGSLRLGWLTGLGFAGALLGLALGLWGLHTLVL